MRKSIVTLLISCIFVLSITTSDAASNGIMLGDIPRNSILYQSLKNNELSKLNQIIILPQQSFDQKEAARMINRIASLPHSLVTKIEQHGIRVKLFTGNLTDNRAARQLSGKTPRGYNNSTTWDDVPGIGGGKVVLVKIGSSENGKGHGSVNLELHELAHSIDRIVFDNVSQKREFLQAWENEQETLFPGISYFSYPEEYFAETFAMYFLNAGTKDRLKEKAPATYKFFNTIL